MMENYERTIELVEIAQESAGRGEEQFAKSQDTLTAKLNTLQNTWEQFRLKFMDEKIFKDAVDILNKLLDIVTHLDVKQFVSLGIIGITIGKTIALNIVDSIKGTTQAIIGESKKLSNRMTTTINSAINKTPFKLHFTQTGLEEIRAALAQMGVDVTNLNNQQITQLANFVNMKNSCQSIVEVANNYLKSQGQQETNLNTINESLVNTLSQHKAITQEQEKELRNYLQAKKVVETFPENLTNHQKTIDILNGKSTEKLQDTINKNTRTNNWEKVGQTAGTAIGAALITSITAFVAGQDAASALKAGGLALISTVVPILIQAAVTAIVPLISGPVGIIATVIVTAILGIVAVSTTLKKKEEERYQKQLDNAQNLAKINEELQEQSKSLLQTYQKLNKQQQRYEDAVETVKKYQDKNFLTTREKKELQEAIDFLLENYEGVIREVEDGKYRIRDYEDKKQREQFDKDKNTTLGKVRVNEILSKENLDSANNFDDSLAKEILSLAEGDIEKNRTGADTTSKIQELYGIYGDKLNLRDTLLDAKIDGLSSDIINTFVDGIENGVFTNTNNYNDYLGNDATVVTKYIKNIADVVAGPGGILEQINKKEEEQLVQNIAYNKLIEKGKDEDIASLISKSMNTEDVKLKDYTIKWDSKTNIKGVMSQLESGNFKIFANLFDSISNKDAITQGFNSVNLNNKTMRNVISNGKFTNFDTIKGFNEDLANELELAAKNKGYDGWDNIIKESASEAFGVFGDIIGAHASNYEESELTGTDAQLLEKYSDALEDIANLAQKSEAKNWDDVNNEIKSIADLRSVDDSDLKKFKEYAMNIMNNGLVGQQLKTLDDFRNSGINPNIFSAISSLSRESQINYLDQITDGTLGQIDQKRFENYIVEKFKNFSTEVKNFFSNYKAVDLANASQDEVEEMIQELSARTGKPLEEADKIFHNYVNGLTDFFKAGIPTTIEAVELQAEKVSSIIDEVAYGEDTEKLQKAIEEYTKNGKLSLKTVRDIKKINKDLVNGMSLDVVGTENYILKKINQPVEQMRKTGEQLLKDMNEAQDFAKGEITLGTYYIGNTSYQKNVSKEKIYKDYYRLLHSSNKKDQEEAKKLLEQVAEQDERFASFMERYGKDYSSIMKVAVDKEKIYNKHGEEYQIELQEAFAATSEMLEVTKKNFEDLSSEVEKLQIEIQGLEKDLVDLNKTLIENQEEIEKTYKAWQEAIHGSEAYQASIDGLINYNNLIEQTTQQLTDLEDKIQDVRSVSEGMAIAEERLLLQTQKLGQIGAKKQVIQDSLANTENVLRSNYGNYVQFDQNGLVKFDFAIEDADMNDELKKSYETLVQNYNQGIKDLKDATKEEEEIYKEQRQMRKQALEARVSEENKIKDIIKKQKEDEIKELEDKYKSMEEADNNYLEALKESIDKQKKLREQEQAFEDLAQKEKKLSLMQRDTSGANQKEIQSLQKDVQKDREKLLDDSINNVIDALKELYDKQKEARELEIEAMQATIEDAAALNALMETVISGWVTAEDRTNWFVNNNPEYDDMSLAEKEEYLITLEEESGNVFTSMAILMSNTQSDAEQVAQITADCYNNVSEGITDTAQVTQEAAQKAADEAIKQAQKAYESAVQAMKDTEQKIEETNKKIKDNMDDLAEKEQNMGVQRSLLTNAYINENNSMMEASRYGLKEVSAEATQSMVDIAKTVAAVEGKAFDINELAQRVSVNGTLNEAQAEILRQNGANIDGNFTIIDNAKPEMKRYELWGQPNKPGAPAFLIGTYTQISDLVNGTNDAEKIYNGGKTDPKEKNVLLETREKTVKYATGGLVNYTGPAWVDGTPSKPEAFLSAQDTERIGNAAKLLASIPALTSTSTTSNITNTNVGDTTIEVHINVESISSDYDIDQVVDRVKKDIVEVSQSIGSSVILAK